MDYTKIFNEWYEFSEEEYLKMERLLRKQDGKRRFKKINREGIVAKILYIKKKVDRDDEEIKDLENYLRGMLSFLLVSDDKIVDYIERFGVINSARMLREWTDKRIEGLILSYLRQRLKVKFEL